MSSSDDDSTQAVKNQKGSADKNFSIKFVIFWLVSPCLWSHVDTVSYSSYFKGVFQVRSNVSQFGLGCPAFGTKFLAIVLNDFSHQP